jgi:hypothetical protein
MANINFDPLTTELYLDEFGNVQPIAGIGGLDMTDHLSADDPHPQYAKNVHIEKIEYITATEDQVLNKRIVLQFHPSVPENVKIDVKYAGGPLFLNEDFIVSGNLISWENLELQNLLSVGDKLRIIYTHTGS